MRMRSSIIPVHVTELQLPRLLTTPICAGLAVGRPGVRSVRGRLRLMQRRIVLEAVATQTFRSTVVSDCNFMVQEVMEVGVGVGEVVIVKVIVYTALLCGRALQIVAQD